jgi:hypothetical protein
MTEYGRTWAYESVVGALPGVDVPPRLALAAQFVAFEVPVLALGWYYDLPAAALAGTVAVVVATAGSAEMLRIGGLVRDADAPEPYLRLLFGSSVEVVLAVLAYVALVTYLFVWDTAPTLVGSLFGADPPVLVVYLTLLVLWDLCYRIGTGWWASVVALWRSARYRFDDATARRLARADAETMGFGLLQLVLVPFVTDHPVLAVAVGGHVLAVTLVTGASIALLYGRNGA